MTPVAVQRTETLQPTPEMQAFFQQQRINTAQFPGGPCLFIFFSFPKICEEKVRIGCSTPL